MVIDVKEIWNGRQGGVDQSFLRRYVRVFRVITDDPNDGTATVGGATGIPVLYDAYATSTESDPQSRVTDIRPSQSTDNPKVWEVQVEYSGAANPLTQPPAIRWTNGRYQRIFPLDVNEQPLLNSAGQFFDPPPEGDDSRPTVTITRNEATFNPTVALAYQDAINSDALTIAGLPVAIGQAKVGIESDFQTDTSYTWWQTTYTVEFRREGWAKRELDQGRYCRGEGGKLTPCLDDKGNAVDDPVPLDGSGGQLDDPTPATAHFLSFDIYKQLPFSALALPE